jgi:hypothetical protein
VRFSCGCADGPLSGKEPAPAGAQDACLATKWGAVHVRKAQTLSIDVVSAVEEGRAAAVHDLAAKSLAELKKAEPWYDQAVTLAAADAPGYAAAKLSRLEAPVDQAPWVALIAVAKRDGTAGLLKELRNIVGALEASTSSVAAATDKGRALSDALAHDYVAAWGNAIVKAEAVSRLHHLVETPKAPPARKQ